MALSIEDVLKGENILTEQEAYKRALDYYGISEEQEQNGDRQQQLKVWQMTRQIIGDQTIRMIWKGAEMTPDHLTRDEAEGSMYKVGHEYRFEWLKANESKLDPEDLYWITLDIYSTAPYASMPKQKIRDLKKIRPADYLKDLDSDLTDTDPITVYRGSCNIPDPDRIKYELSWTTDPITAVFFYNRKKDTFDDITEGKGITADNADIVCSYRCFHPALWKATIRKKNIIGVINCRSEHEILQYGSVKDVQEVPITEAQVRQAMDARKKMLKEKEPYFNFD